MNKMRLFVPIRKVDEEQRLVYGLATEEVVDKSDEIMDYATSKPRSRSGRATSPRPPPARAWATSARCTSPARSAS